MNSYIAYTRVSTIKQSEGTSLAEQRLAIERYARDRGLTITHWYEDIQTAAKRGRFAFASVLRKLGSRSGQGLIIHKIDRGARNLREWADLGELIDCGVDVRFAHDDLNLETRGGRLTADIQAVIAADYVRNLREEARKGLQGRLRQGLYPLRAPLGYQDRGRGRAKTPDPVLAPLIIHAFRLYAAGGHTLRGLSGEMAVRGLTNSHGGAMTPSVMARILRRPFYAGWFLIKGQRFEGIHQPLVSDELFRKVQAVLRRNRHPHHRGQHLRYAGRLRCSCGYALTGERQKSYVYYRCHHCPRVSVREDHIETLATPAIGENMRSIMIKEKVVSLMYMPEAVLPPCEKFEYLRASGI
jgi:site-specific DNA recombinase